MRGRFSASPFHSVLFYPRSLIFSHSLLFHIDHLLSFLRPTYVSLLAFLPLSMQTLPYQSSPLLNIGECCILPLSCSSIKYKVHSSLSVLTSSCPHASFWFLRGWTMENRGLVFLLSVLGFSDGSCIWCLPYRYVDFAFFSWSSG